MREAKVARALAFIEDATRCVGPLSFIQISHQKMYCTLFFWTLKRFVLIYTG
ncbi:MAG: hypothetical protein IT362_11585 [Deltaproteobacteria bacterium]|nr:hypothetical protein [Deltaproteobacteria bacterium]